MKKKSNNDLHSCVCYNTLNHHHNTQRRHIKHINQRWEKRERERKKTDKTRDRNRDLMFDSCCICVYVII